MGFSDEYRSLKGWLASKDVTDFQEVDFAEIEQATTLRFDEKSRRTALELLVKYERDVAVWENVPAKEYRSMLKSVVKACDVLEPILKIDSFGFVSTILEKPVELAVWYHSSPKLLDTLKPECRKCQYQHFPSDGDVAEFLNGWRNNAQTLLEEKGQPGRPENKALRSFLEALRQVYQTVGGEGVGCYRDRQSGGYKGVFLTLASSLLAYSEYPVEFVTLAEFIIDSLR